MTPSRCRASAAFHGPITMAGARSGACIAGFGKDPGEVALVDTLNRQDQDGGRVVRMARLDGGAHLFGKRGARLDNLDGFRGALDRALPAVDRNRSRNDVYAGR